MKQEVRRALELCLFVAVIGLSIAIFLLRDQLQNVGASGYFGLCALCFLANSTVLLPAPSLMIAASFALILNPVLVAVTAALGSSLGELTGYIFGSAGRDLSPKFSAFLERWSGSIRSPALLVFVLALLPLPLFDLAGIYSGGARMPLVKFFPLCFLGKLLKLLVYTRAYDIMEWALSVLSV